MSDASTGQTVECPICGEAFDPTVAGGWCTNTECGEWQYTDDESEADDETAATDDGDGDLLSEATEATATDEDTDEAAEAGDAESAAEAAEQTPTDDAGTEAATEADPATAEGDAAAGEDGASETDAEAADADETTATDHAPSTIDCPDCGTELDADANFCVECGADVREVEPAAPLTECPSCGTDVDETDSFCVECGENLDAHRNEGDAGEDDETATDSHSDDAETDAPSQTGTAAEDAVEALEAQSDDESGSDPVPDSLVLEVRGREIPVEDGDTVGREVRAALTDAGRPEDEAVRVHREHVRFVRESDAFYLVDLGDNPTSLNGRTLQKGDREAVSPGDELQLSGVATVTIRAP
ncbi:zinc ribbon domain-containing protein [Halomicroarcula sp. F13]|uniref:Zinc ribbon domain-containing protein n=1 Tax=Haloarcula rubra TaxID=2487747 RepID=A0AAW4PSJ1_9EURY|nr:zinc ribbon domain-containing protein [Halomicroarcula rubra]MBX0323671.1 zinc ribbon domain-containing protein [Halomicroarcula rubra]